MENYLRPAINPNNPLDPNFKIKLEAFKKEWFEFYNNISKEKTPEVDGNGKKVIDQRGQYDYITDAYMKAKLNQYFPGWSFDNVHYQFLGAEWLVGDGTLSIIDEHLLTFGINPPYRRYTAGAGIRITYKSGAVHSLDTIVDIGNNMQGLFTSIMKRAVNRLCNIGDDIYDKRAELEGAGDYDLIFEKEGNSDGFLAMLDKYHIRIGIAIEILKEATNGVIDDLTKITDFNLAWDIIKTKRGIK